MPTAAPILHAPPILWAAARALLATIFTLFGEPSRIAAQHTQRQSERTLLLKWLRAGEALMRHLLLIEAASYARPNTRPLLRARRARVRRLMSFTADEPEKWRVSFRCMDRRRLAGMRRSRPAGRRRSIKFTSAWPLAERAEALLRAFNAPEAYARRLARRLHATPHRSAELVRGRPALEHVIATADFTALREHTGLARRRLESG